MKNTITIRRPDDFHTHFRSGEMLKVVVPHAARQFKRVMAMPNLFPPITTVKQAIDYREDIMAAVPRGSDLEPFVTLYLTDNTKPEDIQQAKESGVILAVKFFPAGATTNSEQGVTNVRKVYPVFEAMEKYDLPLSLHAEVTDPEVDFFDREKVYIDKVLLPLVTNFPALRVVKEHVSTREGVAFVKNASKNVAATITPHHLLINRNDLLVGGIKPHYYCMPIVKTESDRQALVKAATSGSAKFFAGTDSAPHYQSKKESARGAAGCYAGYNIVELYAEVFDRAGKIGKLEGFLSEYGAKFYHLPLNEGEISLVKEEHEVPEGFDVGEERLVPFFAGEVLGWRMKG